MNKFVLLSSEALSFLTIESFPSSLQDALVAASMAPISCDSEELSFALVEHFECEVDGILHSGEIDLIRWTFRAIERRWILTECVRHSQAADDEEVRLLLLHFSFAAHVANKHEKKMLLLEDSRETVNVFFKFRWPEKDEDLVLAFVPQEIFDQCLTMLKGSSLFELGIDVRRLADD